MYSGSECSSFIREMRMEMQVIGLSVLTIGFCTGSALTQDMIQPEDRWALVGDPGNRNASDEEMPWDVNIDLGSVEYLFRLSRFEVTNLEYMEFAEAYAPFYFLNRPELTEAEIDFSGWNLEITQSKTVLVGSNLNQAANMGWEYAARFVNWLHNGKVDEWWAFETGVFDTATFDQVDGEHWKPQSAHSADSRYWIPTRDEWAKAAYWDPNKHGEGIGGYWRYPNGTDHALQPGIPPSEGGVRNAGDPADGFPFSIHSFPNTQSPFGLFDLSGGEWEWVERRSNGPIHTRGFIGSAWFDTLYNEPYCIGLYDLDRLGYSGGSPVEVPRGLRIATGMYDPADFTQDGQVNFFDVSAFVAHAIDGDSRADLRNDGIFDIDDIRVFLGLYTNQLYSEP